MTESFLDEIRKQSEEIYELVDFIRQHTTVPAFESGRASLEELLAVYLGSEEEMRDFAEWHIPIYIGKCLIDDLGAYWSLEKRKHLAMFGQVYVDGFGNIDWENIYLSQLKLRCENDLKRIRRLLGQAQRAHGYLQLFIETFGSMAGSTLHRAEVEEKCLELGILPKNRCRFRVDRKRVTKYARALKIKLD